MHPKIYKFLTSKTYLNLIKIYHKIFSESFRKDIDISNCYDPELHRLDIIKYIIKKYNIKSYLEIGCDQNQVFSNVDVNRKIGVDPVKGGNIRTTSDIFFKKNKETFDLIFIDGLHRYHQVKKDIINSLKFLNDNGIILIHDCMPFTFYDQACPRAQSKWNGDVWKAIVEFRTYKDIFTCVGGFDTGIGLIIKKNNLKMLDLKRNENFKNLKYKDYFNNFKTYLNIVDINDFYRIIDER